MNRGKYIVVTNNPLVWEKLHTTREMIYKETTFEGLLVELRDRIHQGHMLLTHPLSGSVKPNETPYKSVLISKDKGRSAQTVWLSLKMRLRHVISSRTEPGNMENVRSRISN